MVKGILSALFGLFGAICIIRQWQYGRKLSFSSSIEFKLPASAAAWCSEPDQPPLNYHQCNPFDIVYNIKYTSGLKMLLLSVIKAFETGHCFYIGEQSLVEASDGNSQTVIGRYFEPIGLDATDPIVVNAIAQNRTQVLDPQLVWQDIQNRRIHGTYHNIAILKYFFMEGTVLKKLMLKRMWRLKPHIRTETCMSLESHGLYEDFLAFSITTKNSNVNSSQPGDFIDAAQEAIVNIFQGHIPTVFVATDNCGVMAKFRELKPKWTFVSECDFFQPHNSEVKTLDQADQHFRKFFVDLYGLATAKYYIGSGTSNMAWWAFLMRENRWSVQFLDEPTTLDDNLDVWRN